MSKYKVIISEQAQEDLENLSDIISNQYRSPITSIKYLRGIYSELKHLSRNPEIYSIQTRKSLQAYGPFPRRLNYKRMAIIYNLIGNVVYIRRVIPANTISELYK
jgi:plasmid stabilization system protein ParE